jgi:hypothetical protein
MSSNAKRAKVMHETHCSVDVAARIRVLIALRICIDPVHRAPAKIKPIEVKAAANTQASKQASKHVSKQHSIRGGKMTVWLQGEGASISTN